jgi:hypothetical protein
MKNKIVFAGLLAFLVFTGCVGTTDLGVLDSSIPEDMRCPLEVRSLSVILYDDQPVDWSTGSIKDNKFTIALPPGPHSFMVKWYTSYNNGNYTVTQAQTENVKADFVPGHSYRIYQQNIWLLIFTITKIKVKDVTPQGKA